jgi:hypothetical protein
MIEWFEANKLVQNLEKTNIIKFVTSLFNEAMSSPCFSCKKHVACMGVRRGIYRVLMGKPEGKRPAGNPGINGRIILRWIFSKWDVGAWTGSIWFKIGTGGRHLLMW